jgi:hypothetical protein
MIISGTTGFAADQISLVRDEYTTDPQAGATRVTEWHGTKAALIAKQAELGGRTRLYPIQGPLWSLVTTYTGGAAVPGQEPEDEVATDKWSTHTNILEKEIWMHPLVFAAAVAYDSANPNKFKRQLEKYAEEENPIVGPDCMSDSTSLASPYSSLQVHDVAEDVMIELGRGATHYEDEYLVLRRTRTISTTFPVSMPLYSTRLIYTTAQIPVPLNVLFSLPTFPDAPAQSSWGWRLRTQQSDFVGPTRIEQVFEWVLAAWSTLLYSTSSSNFPN